MRVRVNGRGGDSYYHQMIISKVGSRLHPKLTIWHHSKFFQEVLHSKCIIDRCTCSKIICCTSSKKFWTMCDEHLALFCGKTQNVCLWNGGQKLQMWTMSLPQSSSHLKLVILKWTHLSHGYEDHLEMQWHILHCKSQIFSCTSLSCWLTTQKKYPQRTTCNSHAYTSSGFSSFCLSCNFHCKLDKFLTPNKVKWLAQYLW